MKISVCIPMYNESRVIAKSAEELSGYMASHFEDYEIVFCSDGSSDGCDEIVEFFRQRREYVVERYGGTG